MVVGADHADRAWLLDDRDVWVANPHYDGPPVPHPEDDDPDFDRYEALAVAWDARREASERTAHDPIGAAVLFAKAAEISRNLGCNTLPLTGPIVDDLDDLPF